MHCLEECCRNKRRGTATVFDLAAIKRETEMINEAIAFAVTFKRGPKGRLASARSLGLLPPTDGS